MILMARLLLGCEVRVWCRAEQGLSHPLVSGKMAVPSSTVGYLCTRPKREFSHSRSRTPLLSAAMSVCRPAACAGQGSSRMGGFPSRRAPAFRATLTHSMLVRLLRVGSRTSPPDFSFALLLLPLTDAIGVCQSLGASRWRMRRSARRASSDNGGRIQRHRWPRVER